MVDGPQGERRARRKTGRTKALGTKVTEEFYDELRLYAARHRLRLVEVIEMGFEALKERDRAGLPSPPSRQSEGEP